MNNAERSKRLGLILLVVVLVILSVLATYLWQQKRVDELQKTNKQLTAQVTALQQTNKTLSQQNQSSAPSAQTPTPQPSTPATSYTSGKGVKVTVYSPPANTAVTSPLGVIGEIPGNWSFEAQFPVKLVDQNNVTIAQATGHVLGTWMTDQPVPFSVQLTYSSKPAGTGSLILSKDNPSGQQANQDSVSIPVKF